MNLRSTKYPSFLLIYVDFQHFLNNSWYSSYYNQPSGWKWNICFDGLSHWMGCREM